MQSKRLWPRSLSLQVTIKKARAAGLRPALSCRQVEDVLDRVVAQLFATTVSSPRGDSQLPPGDSQLRYTIVDTPAGLEQVAACLSSASVFAVDVEYSAASFHGFVCSIQLSAGSGTSWFIDCLVEEVRHAVFGSLGHFFEDPATVKLLHGGSNDVRWLATNFGIHTRCIFDTAVAAKWRGHSSLSLAALSAALLQLPLDKSLQRADWRQRPLPPRMLHYAVNDAALLFPIGRALVAAAGDAAGEAGDAIPFLRAIVEESTAQHTTTLRALDLAPAEHWNEALHRRQAHSSMQRSGAGGSAAAWVRIWLALCKWRHYTALAEDEPVTSLLSNDDVCLIADGVCGGGARHACSSDALVRDVVSELAAARYCDDIVRCVIATAASQVPGDDCPHPGPPAPDGVGPHAAPVAMDAAARALPPAPAPSAATAAAVARARSHKKAARACSTLISRASPLYANIKLFAPSGDLLAVIDARRAATYLQLGAAELVVPTGEGGSLQPLPQQQQQQESGGGSALVEPEALLPSVPPGSMLRLLRPPGGPGHAGDAFHLTPKENRCVICGVFWEPSGEVVMVRYYVVPHSLRTHFPLAAKSYTNHDVVLACGTCHHRLDVCCATLLKRVAAELGVPLSQRDAEKQGLLLSRADGAATADDGGCQPSGVDGGASLQGWGRTDVVLAALTGFRRTCVTLLQHAKGRMSLPDKRLEQLQRAAAVELASLRALLPPFLAAQPELRHAVFLQSMVAEQPTVAEEEAWVARQLRDPQFLGHATELSASPIASAYRAFLAAGEGGEAPAYNPQLIIVRAVLSGDAAWQRAEPFYPGARLPIGGAPAADPAACGIIQQADATGASGLSVAAEDRLTRFVQRWRAHFVSFMRPRALPQGWDVGFMVIQKGIRRKGQRECDLVLELMHGNGGGMHAGLADEERGEGEAGE